MAALFDLVSPRYLNALLNFALVYLMNKFLSYFFLLVTISKIISRVLLAAATEEDDDGEGDNYPHNNAYYHTCTKSAIRAVSGGSLYLSWCDVGGDHARACLDGSRLGLLYPVSELS